LNRLFKTKRSCPWLTRHKARGLNGRSKRRRVWLIAAWHHDVAKQLDPEQRNVIERRSSRLKDWRRIATRFDRNTTNFFTAVALAATAIWWR